MAAWSRSRVRSTRCTRTTPTRSWPRSGTSSGSERVPVRRALPLLVAALVVTPALGQARVAIRAYDVPAGGHPHDVAVGTDGIVWYTAQRTGHLGRLDPATGIVDQIGRASCRERG